ncbi:hypothetical protein [Streptomyces sp. LNU-CPARS28]|uniref:hypothetical protein n=1 Tax=Streptomyces sp. LNU-CPARS28 TaxID=3137371 RepID=UPI003134A180
MIETIDTWARTEGLERAKDRARQLLAALFPGQTGTRMADEVAEKLLAAAYTPQDNEPPAPDG